MHEETSNNFFIFPQIRIVQYNVNILYLKCMWTKEICLSLGSSILVLFQKLLNWLQWHLVFKVIHFICIIHHHVATYKLIYNFLKPKLEFNISKTLNWWLISYVWRLDVFIKSEKVVTFSWLTAETDGLYWATQQLFIVQGNRASYQAIRQDRVRVCH